MKGKTLREGKRVRYLGLPSLGPPHGSLGTVAKVATPGGRSAHPDPASLMPFVEWDDGHAEGVYSASLERHR